MPGNNALPDLPDGWEWVQVAIPVNTEGPIDRDAVSDAVMAALLKSRGLVGLVTA